MRKEYAVSLAALITVFATAEVRAQQPGDEAKTVIKIESQPLDRALSQLGKQLKIQIGVYSDDASELRSEKIEGQYTGEEALNFMLDGSGLLYKRVNDRMIAVGSPERLSALYDSERFQVARYQGGAEGESLQRSGSEAPEESQGTPVTDDTIVVTASRRREALQDTAMAITVVNPEEFALGGLTTLEDVVNYIPGVNFADGGSSALQTITIRGVSQTLVSPTVAIYLDDIPLGGGGQFGEAQRQQPDLVKVDLDRIEVLKGPQGTLYGASSMGGLIRYITKDPSAAGEIGGSFSVDFSQTKEGGHSHLTRGSVDLPILEDQLGIRLSGFFQENGGFIDRDISSVDGAADNVNASDVRGGLAKVVAHFSEDFSFTFNYLRNDTRFNGTNSVNLIGPPFEPTVGPFLSSQGAQDNATTLEVFGGTFAYDLGWANLQSTTSHQRVTLETNTDFTANLGPLIELFSGTGPGSVLAAPFTQFIKTERLTEEIRLTSADSKNVEWIIGGFMSLEDSSNIQKLVGEPIDFTLVDTNFPAKLNEYAIFGDLTYYLTPNFDVTIGARVSYTDTNVQLTDAVGLLVADLPLTTATNTIPTYLFNARYRPVENLSLYTRVARGYRPATAALPVLDGSGNPAVPPIIREDTLWSFEGGAKGDLMDGLFAFDFAGWYLMWQDLQAFVFVQGVGTGGNANSDVTAYGFEGAVNLYPIEGLAINTNFAFTNSTLDDDETVAFGALAGEHMPGLPKWTFSVNGKYEFPVNENLTGFLGGGARYIGDATTGFEGGIGQDGSVITPVIASFPLESYVLADFRAGVKISTPNIEEVAISFYVNNAFNEYAFSNGSAVPLIQGLFVTAQVVRPRTFGAVVSVGF